MSDSEYVQFLYSVGAISYVCIVMCENNLSQYHFVHPQSTCAGTGLYPGLCNEMVATSFLSRGTATGCVVEFTEIILEDGGLYF